MLSYSARITRDSEVGKFRSWKLRRIYLREGTIGRGGVADFNAFAFFSKTKSDWSMFSTMSITVLI